MARVTLDIKYLDNFLDSKQMSDVREYVRHHGMMRDALESVHRDLDEMFRCNNMGIDTAEEALAAWRDVGNVLKEVNGEGS